MALTRITKGVIKPNENYDTHNINSTGIVTAIGLDVNGNGDISGNLSVGGVLTYEDVTSIDSVGIITAQKDIHVGAGISVVGVGTFGGGIKVGTGITIGPAGVGTFTSVHAIDSFACQKYPTTKISFPTNSDHLQIFTSNTQRMRFYAAGTIFIGEEAQGPSGNASLYLNTSSTSVFSDSSRLYDQPNKAMVHIKNYNATGGGEAGIVLHNDNGAAGVVAIYGKKTSNYISDCIFRLRDGGSTSVESFRVKTTGIQVGTGVTIETNGQANFAGITTVSGTDLVVKPPTVSTSRIKLGYAEQMKIIVSSSNQNVIQSTAAYLQIASNNVRISRQDLNLHMASFLAGQQCKLTYNYVDRIATSGVGATVYGQFDTTNLNIAGVSTFTGNIDANGDLDVDGHTNLDNVSISGITTSGNINISSSGPRITFSDTNENPDFYIEVNASQFLIQDATNNAQRFRIQSNGVVDINGNTNFSGGIDVTGGPITATGIIETTGSEIKITGAEPRLTFTVQTTILIFRYGQTLKNLQSMTQLIVRQDFISTQVVKLV